MTETKTPQRRVLIIGAGLYGLATAKVFINDDADFFTSVSVFDRHDSIGGVWAEGRTYNGLQTNSPILTYEYPEFPYPPEIAAQGDHPIAQNVCKYLNLYADHFGITPKVRFNTQVLNLEWQPTSKKWLVETLEKGNNKSYHFEFVVVCTGLYHTSFSYLKPEQYEHYEGNVYHSADLGELSVRKKLTQSNRVVVVGAGKSALDISAVLAQGRVEGPPVPVTILYRMPHWISPQKVLRGTINFQWVLYSRFVELLHPFYYHPTWAHWLFAETSFGVWLRKVAFQILGDDFVKSLKQYEVPQTIAKHPLEESLSGATHVEPMGYLQCVKDGRIQIARGDVVEARGKHVFAQHHDGTKTMIEADNIVMGTGYKLSVPFMPPQELRNLGLIAPKDKCESELDMPLIRLHRLLIPPGTLHPHTLKNEKYGVYQGPVRNIAFNGFAYTLNNPLVAVVAAHYLADYFRDEGVLPIAPRAEVDKEIDSVLAWQAIGFGKRGEKGTHLGPHATLYIDLLLEEMGMGDVGHFSGVFGFWREWFWNGFAKYYSDISEIRKERRATGLRVSWVASSQNLLFWNILTLSFVAGLVWWVASYNN